MSDKPANNEVSRTPEEELKHQARTIFGRLLNQYGYMRDPDGQDHCHDCWEKYLSLLSGDPDYLKQVRKDSKRTAQLLTDAPQTLRAREGWWVACEGPGTGADESFSHGDPCPEKFTIFVADNLSEIEIHGKGLSQNEVKKLQNKSKHKVRSKK